MKTNIKRTLNGYSVEVSRAQDEELAGYLSGRGIGVTEIRRPYTDNKVSNIIIGGTATKKEIEALVDDFDKISIKAAY